MEKKQLRMLILELLVRIEKDQSYSHLLINKEIKRNDLAPKDEALLTQIVYGTLERKMTLDYYLSSFVQSNKKLEPWVKMLLRMSIYQMVFLDKIPDHAIIHEAVEIAKKKGHRGIQSFVNAVLRNVQRKGVRKTEEISDPLERLAIETSHPLWLVKRWTGFYGYETTKDICHANLKKKPLSVRIQPLKITLEEAIAHLKQEGFQVKPSIFSDQGLVIEKGNILMSSLMEQGMLTIQDQSSMLATEILQPEPGMTVLDACSAPGGKATHIAEKMADEGLIYAHDLHKKKVKLIEEKQKSLGLTIIHASHHDARKLKELYADETFDRILVDAPCSGLGVISGKPEIKYTKTKEDVERLHSIQMDILNHVKDLLKPNGRIVYSTCTIDKKENEQVIEKFLAMNPQFAVDTCFLQELPEVLRSSMGATEFGLQLFPQHFGTDGFFLTRLRKNQ